MVLPATLLAALVTIVAGCGQGELGGGGFTPPPMPVETALVVEGPVADRFEAVGTIEAGEAITVVSEITASVVRLPFRGGQRVGRGELIAQLDDAQLQASVARTEALRDQSQITHDRVKSIVDQKAGAPQDLDDAAADLKVAEANLALARANLAKTRIVAPWEGILGDRQVSPGAFLRAGDAITTLTAIDEIKVTFSAPERYLSKFESGAPVTVSTTAFPGVELSGEIDVIDPVLDPAIRSARIIARVENPGGRFRPGMSADISVVLSERASALTIPSEAVFAEGDQILVFVVQPDSTVTRKALVLGTRLAGAVEVTEGLEPGMRVVRAGHQKLFEGARVMPVMSRAAAGAEAAADRAGAR
jgi:membrane fusion protein (multidrug efflux system)